MRSRNRLSARAVQSINSPGRYADGGNLYLSVGNGGRSWVFIYRDRVTRKLREMGLGPVGAVPLADARQKAAEGRRLLYAGKDPLAEKRALRAAAAKARTFGDFADEFVESVNEGFKNPKHRYQWKKTLEVEAASLRPLLVHQITTGDVLKVLEPIWHTKHETALRLRGRIERVLSAAKASGLREGENPARWKDNLQPHLGKQRRTKQHLAAMPYKDVPAFMVDLRERQSTSARALEFTILTAARTGESIGARLSEFDLAEKLWIVPAERMKAKRIHRVPLPDRAVEIVRSMKRSKASELIFQNHDGDTLSDAAMLECFRDLRDGLTVHGFRSSFRDWAGDETSFPRDLAETALAHVVEDETEAAYRRSDALKRRRQLMVAWSRYCDGGSKVVAIQGTRRAG